MIEKNQTWVLVDRPNNKNIIGVKWIFKKKTEFRWFHQKTYWLLKAILNSLIFIFYETFALVARLDTIRLLLALAAQKGWKIHQLDVKFAFLNGFHENEIYIKQLEGFVTKGQETRSICSKRLYMG